MRGKTTLKLLLIFLILFTSIYFIEVKRSEAQSKRAELAMRLFNVPIDNVRSYSIKTSKSEIVLYKESDKWLITSPVQTLVDSNAVVENLASILGIKIERIIQSPESDLNVYGLTEPRGAFQLNTIDNKTIQLMVGNENPIGGFLYVKFNGSADITLVSQSLWNQVNKGLFDLRDRKIVHINPLEVQRIKISRSNSETIVLEKREDAWWLVQPVQSLAKSEVVLTFLNRLASARIREFIDESLRDLSRYGLDSARLRIDLFSGSEDQPTTLVIGNPKDKDRGLVYASNQSLRPIFLLDTWLADNLEKSADDFRDSTVVLSEHQF